MRRPQAPKPSGPCTRGCGAPALLAGSHGKHCSCPGARLDTARASHHARSTCASLCLTHPALARAAQAGRRSLLAACALAALALSAAQGAIAPANAPAAAAGAAGLLPPGVLQPTPVDFAVPGLPQPPRPAPAPELPPEVRALATQGIQALFSSLAARLSTGAGRKLQAGTPGSPAWAPLVLSCCAAQAASCRQAARVRPPGPLH